MRTLFAGEVKVYHFGPNSGLARRNVLFSHATGIAALTYKEVLQRWSNTLQVNIFAYDGRGHGESTLDARQAYAKGFTSITNYLCEDLKEIFNRLKECCDGPWSLAGHSLGGWLALYTANDICVDQVILLDVPLLPPSSAFLWAAACFLHQRGFHPLSRPARRRKRMFRSQREALNAFKRNPFFRNWAEQHIVHYIEANFETLEDATLKLRHDPEWEADLFESQPALHTLLFLKMQAKRRKEMRVDLIAGDESKICSPRSIRYFHHFFPRMRWLVVPQGGHMFPFENTTGLLDALALVLSKPVASVRNNIELEAI